MRIEVYNEKDEPEQVVRLKLVGVGGHVRLLEVDSDGATVDHLLSIVGGGIIRIANRSCTDLPTDDKGRVLLVDE